MKVQSMMKETSPPAFKPIEPPVHVNEDYRENDRFEQRPDDYREHRPDDYREQRPDDYREQRPDDYREQRPDDYHEQRPADRREPYYPVEEKVTMQQRDNLYREPDMTNDYSYGHGPEVVDEDLPVLRDPNYILPKPIPDSPSTRGGTTNYKTETSC